ncbi:hypothetical protein B0H13DRAFT_1968471 [Mycena leptocephala]|nr:hypothetical protein B0H13DRAFT_1968471 [Mycena leptocephala]
MVEVALLDVLPLQIFFSNTSAGSTSGLSCGNRNGTISVQAASSMHWCIASTLNRWVDSAILVDSIDVAKAQATAVSLLGHPQFDSRKE